MTKGTNQPSPSLLEARSRGGDVAEGGFSFQEQYVLSRIPAWLAHDGFTLMVREAMGDTEAKFFVPGHGYQIEFIEAKNHRLNRSEFWAEVDRFQEIDGGSPGDYRWFTLASAGIADSLRPLVNGLRRLRLPYGFYEAGSAIRENSFADYAAIVTKLGRSEQDARFLFEKVLLEPDLELTENYGKTLFIQSLVKQLPEFGTLAYKALDDLYTRVGDLVRQHRIQPIARKELEAIFDQSLPAEQQPLSVKPLHLHTMNTQADSEHPNSLRFEWEKFFGGTERNYPPASEWNQELLDDLNQTRNWVLEHRGVRHIKLSGSRRLSAMLAIGHVFSAVGGFTVTMNHRNNLWATNAHPAPDTPPYIPAIQFSEGAEHGLVIVFTVGRDIFEGLDNALVDLNLNNLSRLSVHGSQPIVSPEQANAVVQEVKNIIAQYAVRMKCDQAHLFYAGPSHLALFLSHRLNATVTIQCYEWVGETTYVPTCRFL
jgi:hypothetical protein